MKILIRIDADHNVGLGHVIRITELLRHLTLPLDIHIYGRGEKMNSFFGNDTTLHPFSELKSEIEQAGYFLDITRKINADVIFIDHPNQTPQCWQEYYKSEFPVIAIDDYGGPVKADIIFNGTILDEYHHYPLMSDHSNIFSGADYCMINPVFGKAYQRDFSDGQSLLIVIGGGKRATEWALTLLGEESPFLNLTYDKITMVVGATFPEMKKIQVAAKMKNIRLLQNIRQLELALLLTKHTMALTTGGMIVYEALASGCPIIIFPQEKNLVRESEYFSEENAVIDLGYEGGMTMSKVTDKLALLFDNVDLANCLSKAGLKKVDGKGMLRVANKLGAFLLKIKEGRMKA